MPQERLGVERDRFSPLPRLHDAAHPSPDKMRGSSVKWPWGEEQALATIHSWRASLRNPSQVNGRLLVVLPR